jgi:hypothetical protein
MPVHEVVNDGTGAWLVGGAPGSVPGLTTTENSWLLPPRALVVAVRPDAVPVGTAALESAIRELTLPLPGAAGADRVVEFAGLVQIWAAEDFSLHAFTSQDPAWATATEGVVKLVVVGELGPAVLAEAVTEEVPPLLR